MLARLLWQTWRQSWRTMLAAIPIALLLILAINATTWLGKTGEVAMLLCPLLLPALYGALVFRADQRLGNRQFLVNHASQPRYVWLARQMVWLSTLVLLGVLVQVVGSLLAAYGLRIEMEQELRHNYFHSVHNWNILDMHLQMRTAMSTFWSFTSVAWCAALSAYGVGQLCSMLLAREVLAGFLAMLLAAVLTAWAIVVGAWELNPAWFVLPIGLVAMLATWLRAPAWIVGRQGLRYWIAPTLAVVLPLLLVFSRLPHARLNQLDLPKSGKMQVFMQQELPFLLNEQTAAQAAGRETASEYERLHSELIPWQEAIAEVRVDGELYEELFLHVPTADSEEEIGQYGGEMGGFGGEMSGYGESNLAALTPAQNPILREFETARQHAYAAANQIAIKELKRIAQLDFLTLPEGSEDSKWRVATDLENLLLYDAARLQAEGELQSALERLLIKARLHRQMLTNKSTAQLARVLSDESGDSLDSALLQWAQHPSQTSESIKSAITGLQKVYANYPPFRNAVVQDHMLLREVLLDKRPPAFLSHEGNHWTNYLPYLANKLLWERQRALEALDMLTNLRLQNQVLDHIAIMQMSMGDPTSSSFAGFRELFTETTWQLDDILDKATFAFDWNAYLTARELYQRCTTSYLLQNEMASRVDNREFLLAVVDAETVRRGLIVRLALLAYRLDHGAYPETLAELSPEYLSYVPLDPYTNEPFEYRPEGLELPLSWNIHHSLDKLPAGTPLLWSVGTNAFVLETRDRANYVDHDFEQQEITSVWEYYFRPTRTIWGRDYLRVFPLPSQND